LWTVSEEQILDHVVQQQVELAQATGEPTGVIYLPNHVVKKEQRGMMKWRIVFDASSRVG